MADPGNLKVTVQQQMMAAMKRGDKTRTQVLRMVLSEIKAQEADYPEADPQVAVAAYAKKLKKAAEEYEKINQPQQVATLQGEMAMVAEFLPKPLDEGALAALVEQTIAALGTITAKDSGRVIGAVMKAAGGTADANKVRAMVASKLK